MSKPWDNEPTPIADAAWETDALTTQDWADLTRAIEREQRYYTRWCEDAKRALELLLEAAG
jgi:exonuclease III